MFRHEPSAVRLVRGRDKKGSDSYRLVDGSLDLVGIRNDFADGYTIVLDGVEQYVRAVGTLARSIEVELNFPIQVNTYITPPGQRGWLPTTTTTMCWSCRSRAPRSGICTSAPTVPPREIQRDKEKAVAVEGLPAPTDVRLEAGDVLYVPRGRVHEAETVQSNPSI